MKQKNVLILSQPVSHIRLGGIARFAKTHGWHLVIADRLSRLPIGWIGDGALVSARGTKTTLAFILGLIDSGIPVVDMTIDHPEIEIPRVSGDHEQCGRLAARHFAQHHFTEAAWFSTIWSYSHALRYRGFADEWKQLTGKKPQRWVLAEMLSAREFDNWKSFTSNLAELIMTSPLPLAVLGYDDADAARVLTACMESDIAVPRQVAIMGIGDDTIVCENQGVTLSSVGHDLGRIGYTAAALLDRIMAAKKAHPKIILIQPSGIVARASTDTIAATDPLVRKALDFMRAHQHEAPGTIQIARALKISRTRLDRLFVKTLHAPVQKVAMRMRLDEAAFLLKDTDTPIKQIADQLGFSSAAHLTVAFRQALGTTPSAFRHQRSAVSPQT